jgi:epoxyqueuosine reductase
LRDISETLQQWFWEEHRLSAYPLPYHVEKGGLFLKDAAVFAGLGIIGRNNLLLHPEWGPRIRLRSILLEGELETTPLIENFSPCETCDRRCHKACPQHAFAAGTYSRSPCLLQMHADEAHKVLGKATDTKDTPRWVTTYCRTCEFACPIGQ